MMRFNKLLAVLGIDSDDTRIVYEITTCHKRAREGVLFVAMKGFRFDSNTMIGEALHAGAMVIGNVEKEGVVQVDNSLEALALLAEAFYGYPHRYLKMIGITGTSGKSSVSHYVAELLHANHKRVCVIGSDGVFMEEIFLPTTNTTPSSLFLSRVLHECVANDIEYVVMEVSSHAAEQGRVKGIYFDVVLYLNLGHDHLDYHPSIYQYRESKAKLLEQLKDDGRIVVNGDDKELLSLMDEARHPLTMFGQTTGQYRISDIQLSASGSTFRLSDLASYGKVNESRINAGIEANTSSKIITSIKANPYDTNESIYIVQTNVLAHSNVMNTVAAMLACHMLDYPLDTLSDQAVLLTPLSGRMEVVYRGDFVVMIDFAHTVDAFVQLGHFVQSLDVNRRVVVMGLGGDRDKTKRPLIGKALNDMFDVLILTSDNPRSEDPLHIIADVCRGCGYDKVKIEVSRQRAIQVAIQGAEVGDIIVIAGKGNEQFQQIGDVRMPFVDKDVIAQAIAQRFQ